MRIVERIKDAVEHTTDSWQQKLLNEYSASDDPATRARKIISELVKQLDKPNQVIINDIVSLVYALASNPDASVDLEQVLTTAEMLIHELVEPIPNPDKRLMDELLHIVVNASSHRSQPQLSQMQNSSQATSSIQSNQTQPPNPATQSGMQAAQAAAAAQSQPAPSRQQAAQIANPPKPSKSDSKDNKSGVDAPMIKLIMDEMKEVIKKNQLTEQKIADVENKLTGRISTTYDDIQTLKDKTKKQDAELETINKNLDKFISLYEIVINQYNPFIEHLDEKDKKNIPTSLISPQKTPETPTKITTQAPSEQLTKPADSSFDHDIHLLIDQVRDMTDETFSASKEKISKWITMALKDEKLSQDYSQTATKAQALTLLLKKSLG